MSAAKLQALLQLLLGTVDDGVIMLHIHMDRSSLPAALVTCACDRKTSASPAGPGSSTCCRHRCCGCGRSHVVFVVAGLVGDPPGSAGGGSCWAAASS